MLRFTRKPQEEEIERLVMLMKEFKPWSEEYKAMAEQVEVLARSLSYTKDKDVNKNTMISAGAALAQVWMILNYEQLNVITTKALAFVGKVKV